MSAGSRRGRALAVAGIGVALVAVVVAVVFSVSAGGGGGSVAPQAERPATPDVAFTLGEGERRSLKSFRGRPVVVAFVLPYCGTCIDTLRMLDDVAEAHPDGSAVAIAVNVGLSGAADPGLRGASAFGVDEADTVVVIDSDGRVITRGARLSTKDVLGAIAAT